MKKNIVLLVISCWMLHSSLFSQVQIQTTLPTVGLVQKNQLWNLILLNSSASVLDGRIELVLFDRQTSQELMTAYSNEFSLSKGSVIVNVNKLGPVNYNYIGIEPDRNINTLLPVGAYSVCYSFVRNPNTDKREILAEECTAFDVEPLSPPMLSFPADSAVLEAAPTQFSWTPPTPAALLNRLHYEVIITEVQPLQKAAEAVEENIPFFNTDQAPNHFMSYSGAQPSFEKDKWYAWQVIARDDNNYAGKSEVWVFKVKKESELEKILKGTAFMKMKPDVPDMGIAPDGILKINYFSRGTEKTAKVVLSDLSLNDQQDNDRPFVTVSITPGENQIQLNLKKVMTLSEQNIYKAEITGSSGEKCSVLFRVKYFQDK